MTSKARNDFLAAFEGENDHTPVWFMRQAGRYLPAYKKVRSHKSIKQMCSDPAMMADLTYAPVRDLGVDAGIIFFDITLPFEAMGCRLEFVDSIGPVINDGKGVTDIASYDKSMDSYSLSEGIKKFHELYPGIPLIGFAGGPITLASYLIAGRSDRDLILTRKKLYENPTKFKKILDILNDSIIALVKTQIDAGVDVIQIFDSWAGSLSAHEFENYGKDYLNPLFDEISSLTRTIYFSASSGRILERLKTLDADFISIDSHTVISTAYERLDRSKGVQGNLDPFIAATSGEETLKETKLILQESKSVERFIFNLGHGVLPQTPPEHLLRVVEEVHSFVR